MILTEDEYADFKMLCALIIHSYLLLLKKDSFSVLKSGDFLRESKILALSLSSKLQEKENK